MREYEHAIEHIKKAKGQTVTELKLPGLDSLSENDKSIIHTVACKLRGVF